LASRSRSSGPITKATEASTSRIENTYIASRIAKLASRFRLSVPPPTVTSSLAMPRKARRKKATHSVQNRGERAW